MNDESWSCVLNCITSALAEVQVAHPAESVETIDGAPPVKWEEWLAKAATICGGGWMNATFPSVSVRVFEESPLVWC